MLLYYSLTGLVLEWRPLKIINLPLKFFKKLKHNKGLSQTYINLGSL